MFERVPGRDRIPLRTVLPLLGLLIAAGILLVRVPGGGQQELPDPETMALLGDSRFSSAEIVEIWEQRVVESPQVANTIRLARAQLTLAGDTGDLEGYEVAERTALGATSRSPDDHEALLTLAAARAGQHDFAGALDLAEQVLADQPTSMSAVLAVGDYRLGLGDYRGAGEAYRRAVDRLGQPAALLSRQARLEATVGRLTNARHLAERALIDAGEQDLRHADAAFYWFQLASYEFALGRIDDAGSHLESALIIDPDNLGTLELQGKVLAAAGDLHASAAVYERLVGDGGAADLHGELAKIYARLGRPGEAGQQIELGLAAAAAADRFPAERRHLIGFLADHAPVEALRLAELDLLERQDVAAHAWHAWALYRTGDIAGARTAIDPALRYRTEDARLLYQAATILSAAANLDRVTGSSDSTSADRTTARDLIRRSQELNSRFDIEHGERAAALAALLDERAAGTAGLDGLERSEQPGARRRGRPLSEAEEGLEQVFTSSR